MQYEVLTGAPEDEGISFLVLAPDYYGDELVWHQVSWFEGNLYPDAKSYVIDRSDQICLDSISAWVALPCINKVKETQ